MTILMTQRVSLTENISMEVFLEFITFKIGSLALNCSEGY